jgi:hypothetical protein
MGKTTEASTTIGVIRATTDLDIEFTTPSGEVLSVPFASLREFDRHLRHAMLAAEEWQRTITGQRVPRIWWDDATRCYQCEYMGHRGAMRSVSGRKEKRCHVCNTYTAERYEAVRIPWNTPALPVLCALCFGRFQTGNAGPMGKLAAVKSTT